jgi:hypothetical protein
VSAAFASARLNDLRVSDSKFLLSADASSFWLETAKAVKGNESSVFAERTEDSSALQYFQVSGRRV